MMLALFSKRPFFVLFCASTMFAGCVAAFIQLVFLPYIAPGMHAGHGLLVGGDWIGFHEIAAAKAQEIIQNGWGKWQLQPAGHAPAGIASAVYVFFPAEPWTLIPLNALLHGLSATVLAHTLSLLTRNTRISILAALPFVFYPSATTWYAQLHKDGFYIAGFLLCFHGWVRLSCVTENLLPFKTWIPSFMAIIGGTLLIAMVRDYGVKLAALTGLLFAGMICFHLTKTYRLRAAWVTLLASIALLSLPLLSNLLSNNHYFDAMQGPALTSREKPIETTHPAAGSQWTPSSWLPKSIDQQLEAISLLRKGHLDDYPMAKSNIDRNIRLASAADFISYLPRALQVGLLSPFPRDWISDGSIAANTVMRRITALEMLGTYLGLLFLPYVLLRWRRTPAIWMFAATNLTFTLLYAYTIPNIGTLYRMRYGFLMSISALGISGLLHLATTKSVRVNELLNE